jgi:hypothetical protein
MWCKGGEHARESRPERWGLKERGLAGCSLSHRASAEAAHCPRWPLHTGDPQVALPSAPREEAGLYWGYTTRMAKGISGLVRDCPFEGGYDLKVGTSEHGQVSVAPSGISN